MGICINTYPHMNAYMCVLLPLQQLRLCLILVTDNENCNSVCTRC